MCSSALLPTPSGDVSLGLEWRAHVRLPLVCVFVALSSVSWDEILLFVVLLFVWSVWYNRNKVFPSVDCLVSLIQSKHSMYVFLLNRSLALCCRYNRSSALWYLKSCSGLVGWFESAGGVLCVLFSLKSALAKLFRPPFRLGARLGCFPRQPPVDLSCGEVPPGTFVPAVGYQTNKTKCFRRVHSEELNSFLAHFPTYYCTLFLQIWFPCLNL